jgi:opacity protein-like surface antigen
MKKFVAGLVVVMFLFFTSEQLNAQNSVSLGLAYGFDIEEVGIQLGGMHRLNDKMSVGGDFVYYLIGDEEFFGMKFSQKAFEINGNFRYNFLSQDGFELYGLGTLGLHIVSVKVTFGGDSDSESDSEVALGIGGGAQYSLGNLSLFAEPRLFLSGFDQFQFTAGVRVRI